MVRKQFGHPQQEGFSENTQKIQCSNQTYNSARVSEVGFNHTPPHSVLESLNIELPPEVAADATEDERFVEVDYQQALKDPIPDIVDEQMDMVPPSISVPAHSEVSVPCFKVASGAIFSIVSSPLMPIIKSLSYSAPPAKRDESSRSRLFQISSSMNDQQPPPPKPPITNFQKTDMEVQVTWNPPMFPPPPEPPDRGAVPSPSLKPSLSATTTKGLAEIRYPDVYSYTMLVTALQVYDQMSKCHVAVWNAINTGCTDNGLENFAFDLFKDIHRMFKILVMEGEEEEPVYKEVEAVDGKELINVGSTQFGSPQLSLNALRGVAKYQTMRVSGLHNQNILQILIDCGSTHNFLDLDLAKKLGCKWEPITPLTVTKGGGIRLHAPYTKFIPKVMVLPLECCDLMLRAQWLSTLCPSLWNFSKLPMEFFAEGEMFVLMEAEILKLVAAIDDPITSFEDLFAKSRHLPLYKRGFDHRIYLKDGSGTFSLQPCRYSIVQRDIVVNLMEEMLQQSGDAVKICSLHSHQSYKV